MELGRCFLRYDAGQVVVKAWRETHRAPFLKLARRKVYVAKMSLSFDLWVVYAHGL